MPVLGSSLLSSVFTSFFYLIMVWTFASQPALLGIVIAAYELTPNVLGIAWAWLRLPFTSIQQLQLGWLLRIGGTFLLLDVNNLVIKVVGIIIVAVTPTIVSSLEKASLTISDSSTSTMMNKFVWISQIQQVTSLFSPILAGYFISQHSTVLLTVIMVVISLLGLFVSNFFPISTTIRDKTMTQDKRRWRFPNNPVVILVVTLMFLGNLVLWGPTAIAVPTFFQQSHMSATDLGLVLTCGKVGTLLGLQLLRKFQVGIKQMAPSLAFALALYSSGYIVLGIFAPRQVLWWGVVIVIINAVESVIAPFLNTLISFFYPNVQKRAGTMSTVVSLGNLGEPIGSLITGILIVDAAASLRIIGILGSAIGLIFAVLLVRQVKNLSEEYAK